MARSKTTWQKGQSGNPKGRPPDARRLTEALRKIVDADELARKLLDMALKEDYFPALRYIFDRLEGKPKETIEINPVETPRVVGYYPSGNGQGDEIEEPIHDDDEI